MRFQKYMSWFRRCVKNTPRARRAKKLSWRLAIERLEDRLVPSTLINFDDVPGGTVINTHYPGVTFSLLPGPANPTVTNVLAVSDNFAFSSPNVVGPGVQGIQSFFDEEEGIIQAQFASPQGSVSIEASVVTLPEGLGQILDNVFLEAFDANNNALGTAWYPIDPSNYNDQPYQNLTVSSSTNNIAYVQFSATDGDQGPAIFGQFDNLQYASAPVATSFQVTPPLSATAGNPFNITVTCLDQTSQLLSSYRGTVHFTSNVPSDMLPADYTFTAADQGTHTFTVTGFTAGLRDVTVQDTATPSVNGTASINVLPGAVNALQVSDAQAMAGAGSAFTFSVSAEDTFGNLVPSYLGTVHFTSSDPRAALPADYTFGGGDQGKRAFQVTFQTLGLQGLTATDSANATITGSLRSSLTTLFATGVSGPGALLAGGAVDPHYQLVASSDAGNPGPNVYVVNPGWPLAPAGPWLADGPNSQWIAPFAGNSATAAPGNYSYQTTFDLGLFQPSAVQITGQWATDNAGQEIDLNGVNTGIPGTSVTEFTQWQPFTIHSGFGAGVNTLVFKVNNAGTTPNPTGLRVELSGTAAGVVVQPGPARAFVLTGLPGTSAAGTAQKFTVTAEDAAGIPVPEYTGKVHFTSSDPHALLPVDYTFTVADKGTHSFKVTFKTAGPQTVTVTGTDLPAGAVSSWMGDNTAQDSIGGNNGSLQGGATYATGEVNQAFSFGGTGDYFQAPTSGLPVGSGDRTLELWVNVQGLPAPEAFLAGYGNFGTADQTYQLGLSGDTLNFSQWGQALFGPALSLGVWHHVAVTNIGDSVTLYLDGVVVASGTLSINTAAGTQFYMGSIPGSLGSTRRLQGLTDEMTAYNRALGATEIQDIYLNGSAGKFRTDVGSATVTVNSAAAKTLGITGLPPSTVAGTAVSFTVTAKDAYGNVATGYTGTVHFSSTDLKAVLPANYTFTAANAGTHPFTATFKTGGTQTLTATDTVTTTITGKASEKVVAAAATHFLLIAPSTATPGVAFTLTVVAQDAYGNTATSYRGTVHFTCTDPAATLPKDYTFTATNAGKHSFSITMRTVGKQTIKVEDVIDLANKGSATVTV